MTNPVFIKELMTTWQDQSFEYFRDGVEVHHIRKEFPAIAILRYAPGAKVPLHIHEGLETILVLEGVQSDERGDYTEGTLILNPVGTTHSVWSENGCAVLIQWEKPVQILE